MGSRPHSGCPVATSSCCPSRRASLPSNRANGRLPGRLGPRPRPGITGRTAARTTRSAMGRPASLADGGTETGGWFGKYNDVARRSTRRRLDVGAVERRPNLARINRQPDAGPEQPAQASSERECRATARPHPRPRPPRGSTPREGAEIRRDEGRREARDARQRLDGERAGRRRRCTGRPRRITHPSSPIKSSDAAVVPRSTSRRLGLPRTRSSIWRSTAAREARDPALTERRSQRMVDAPEERLTVCAHRVQSRSSKTVTVAEPIAKAAKTRNHSGVKGRAISATAAPTPTMTVVPTR